MLHFDEILELIGQDEWNEACQDARIDAARPDYAQGHAGFDSAIPRQISDYIWQGDETWSQKLDLFLRIYQQMPCYGNLLYLKDWYREFSPEDRQKYLLHAKEVLGRGDLALANPIAYSLWCDFFEDSETVAEAWNTLVADPVPERYSMCY